MKAPTGMGRAQRTPQPLAGVRNTSRGSVMPTSLRGMGGGVAGVDVSLGGGQSGMGGFRWGGTRKGRPAWVCCHPPTRLRCPLLFEAGMATRVPPHLMKRFSLQRSRVQLGEHSQWPSLRSCSRERSRHAVLSAGTARKQSSTAGQASPGCKRLVCASCICARARARGGGGGGPRAGAGGGALAGGARRPPPPPPHMQHPRR
jgi:hypothetical protein